VGTLLLLPDSRHVSQAWKYNNLWFFRTLSAATNADDKTLLFEIVFVIVWLGGAIIAING